jgi:hypothetical protein
MDATFYYCFAFSAPIWIGLKEGRRVDGWWWWLLVGDASQSLYYTFTRMCTLYQKKLESTINFVISLFHEFNNLMIFIYVDLAWTVVEEWTGNWLNTCIFCNAFFCERDC